MRISQGDHTFRICDSTLTVPFGTGIYQHTDSNVDAVYTGNKPWGGPWPL